MLRKLLLLYALLVAVLAGGLTYFVAADPIRMPASAALACFVGLITWLTGLWLQRRLTPPLQNLTDAARRITRGEYGHKVYAADGPVVGELAGAFNSMSERLAEQFAQVEGDRQHLRAILGGMVEGVVAIDTKQRLLFANDKAAQLLEFHPKMAMGHRFWEIVRQRPVLALVDRALETKQSLREEFDWQGAPSKSIAVYVTPLPDSPGQGAILVLHDLSELRRLERLRHEFVANVSHELKTPLAVIKACVETLQDGAVDDKMHRASFLEQIDENSDRLHNLILDLLSLARLESGNALLEFQTIVISDLVHDCVTVLRPRADAKQQMIIVQAPEEPSAAEIRTDFEALQQILNNLIDNAIKYTPDGGSISIRWYGRGDQICFEVEDNGIGIPESDLPRIFERFYRVDKARSRELGGTGLGLAIVKNLAQVLRGSAQVVSQFGHGSVFTVALPRSAA